MKTFSNTISCTQGECVVYSSFKAMNTKSKKYNRKLSTEFVLFNDKQLVLMLDQTKPIHCCCCCQFTVPRNIVNFNDQFAISV